MRFNVDFVFDFGKFKFGLKQNFKNCLFSFLSVQFGVYLLTSQENARIRNLKQKSNKKGKQRNCIEMNKIIN